MITVENKQFKRLFYETGNIRAVGQLCYQYTGSETGSGYEAYGRWFEFDESKRLRRQVCYNVHKNPFGSLDGGACGEEILYADGHSKKIQHAPCDVPCGRFIPGVKRGNYTLAADTEIFEAPSPDAMANQSIRAQQMIEVLEDTHRLLTRNGTTAPWLKIAHGRSVGYIFAGVLDLIPEQDFDFQDPENLKIQPPENEEKYCWDARKDP